MNTRQLFLDDPYDESLSAQLKSEHQKQWRHGPRPSGTLLWNKLFFFFLDKLHLVRHSKRGCRNGIYANEN